jgi:DNA-binding transcriptional ArsR family regulator
MPLCDWFQPSGTIDGIERRGGDRKPARGTAAQRASAVDGSDNWQRSRDWHHVPMPKRNGAGIALLADDTRRQIVALLALRPCRPAGIARAIGLSRPATSRQLRLLAEAGLVRGDRSWIDGRGILYRIDPDAHGRITAWLAGTEVARGPEADRTASRGGGWSADS